MLALVMLGYAALLVIGLGIVYFIAYITLIKVWKYCKSRVLRKALPIIVMSYVPKLLALCNCVIIMGMIAFTIFDKTKPMLFGGADIIVMIISVLVSYAMVNIVRMIEGFMYHNEAVITFQSQDKESEM